MRKALVVVLLVLIAVILIYFVFFRNGATQGNSDHEKGELLKMSFELLGQSNFGAAIIYEKWGWKPESPITLWEAVSNEKTLRSMADNEKFDIPDVIDLESYCIILSYGRQIVEMECQIDPHYGESSYVVTSIFSEAHEGDQVFFYQVDKRNYVPCDLASPCYIMSGDTKVYAGERVLDLNEYDTEREGYTPGV